MTLYYLLVAFVLFFLQHLLPMPAYLRLDLLTLFMVYVTLQAGLLTAVPLALLLGVVLDCYGPAPLGLHAALLFTAVVGTAAVRRHLDLLYVLPQITGVALIMLAQGAVMVGLLHLLLPVPVAYPALLQTVFLQLWVTSLSAPVVLFLFGFLARGWRRWVLRKKTSWLRPGLGEGL